MSGPCTEGDMTNEATINITYVKTLYEFFSLLCQFLKPLFNVLLAPFDSSNITAVPAPWFGASTP